MCIYSIDRQPVAYSLLAHWHPIIHGEVKYQVMALVCELPKWLISLSSRSCCDRMYMLTCRVIVNLHATGFNLENVYIQ